MVPGEERERGKQTKAWRDCQQGRRKAFTLTSCSKDCCYQKGNTDALKHMRRCSSALIIRQMQMKTAPRECSSPVRLATLKKGFITRYVGEGGGPRGCVMLRAGVANGYTLYGGRFSHICQNCTPSDPVIPPLGIYPTKSLHTCEMVCVPMRSNIYGPLTTHQAWF